MNWKPAYALVLLGVTLVTYWGANIMFKRRIKREEKEKTGMVVCPYGLVAATDIQVL